MSSKVSLKSLSPNSITLLDNATENKLNNNTIYIFMFESVGFGQTVTRLSLVKKLRSRVFLLVCRAMIGQLS